MTGEILLNPGVPVARAVEVLDVLARKAANIASGATRAGETFNAYLMWVEEAEAELRGLFRSSMLWTDLYSERYWRIREMDSGRPVRPLPLMTSEVTWHQKRFEDLGGYLRSTLEDFALPRDCVAVMPDTNVLVHYRRYNEIDWPRLVGFARVRLIVPLIVIDELDDLKNRVSGNRSERVAGVIRALQALRGPSSPHVPIDARTGVTLQLFVDPPRHSRRPNHDDEFLARAEYLASIVDSHLVVATGDYGMRLRAQARGLRFIELPDDLRLDLGAS